MANNNTNKGNANKELPGTTGYRFLTNLENNMVKVFDAYNKNVHLNVRTLVGLAVVAFLVAVKLFNL